MELLNVIAAAVGGFGFGAVWYMVLGNHWLAVSGVPLVDGAPANQANPVIYIIGFAASLIVAA